MLHGLWEDLDSGLYSLTLPEKKKKLSLLLECGNWLIKVLYTAQIVLIVKLYRIPYDKKSTAL